jgi:tetratricopeptide (TPR) repeat protein
MRLSCLFILSFWISSWLCSGSAAAQDVHDTDDQARTHFQSGRLYFERGEYEDALREFEAAYALSNRPGLLYNIVLSNERLGRYAEAATRLDQYLRDDSTIEAAQRSLLEARLENLRARASRESEPAPSPTPPSEAQPERDEARGLSTLGVAGVSTLGVGAASLIAFAISGGLALGEDSALAERCGENAGRTCTEEDVSSLRAMTMTADITLAAGLVLAAAGATLLVIDVAGVGSQREEAVAITPLLGPHVAGCMLGGRFQ